jgi:hypothetical protein
MVSPEGRQLSDGELPESQRHFAHTGESPGAMGDVHFGSPNCREIISDWLIFAGFIGFLFNDIYFEI